jgi:hypothetical protein
MAKQNEPARQLPDWIVDHMRKYVESDGKDRPADSSGGAGEGLTTRAQINRTIRCSYTVAIG